MRYCLDSWAVLRWLEGVEPGADKVASLMTERPVMSWMNLGEVFYVSARAAGHDSAHRLVTDLRRRLTVDQVTPARVLEAAAIKAVHPMAFADALALATARAHEAVLLTGDPEILDVRGDWLVEDLRVS